MEVPYQIIPEETLQNLVEEFVSRDGTDYGEYEVELSQKVDQVIALLKSGKAQIVYDEQYDTCSVVPSEE